MSIFNLRAKVELQEMTKRYEETRADLEATAKAKAEIEESVGKLREVQELIVDDIIALKAAQSSYKGNDYQDYSLAVKAISDKYNGKAEWGCLQAGTIVDLRAAFILGEGVKIIPKTKTKSEADAELQFARDFFEYNGLDGEMGQEIAKEAEIEGKVLLRLSWDEKKYRGRPGMVSVRFVSWSSKRYKIEAAVDDYLWYKRATWPASGSSPAGDVSEEEFVYKKFGGRVNEPNEAQPKLMKCLTQVDRLDRALRDLREINHLFASPTPDFQTETPEQATKLLQFLKDKNWKIGKAIAHVGVFKLVGPDPGGNEALIKEIELNTKMISGTTGIPIHFLGLLDLLHNRATGDNTRELVMAATTKERAIWTAAFEELIEKAILMYNAKVQKAPLDPEKVGAEIPMISQDHWANIEKVLIPAALGSIVSKEFVAGQIPGVDLEEEAKKREENEEKELERAAQDLEMVRARAELDRQDRPEGGPGRRPA